MPIPPVFLSRRARAVLAGGAAAVVLYAAAGFFVAPRIVRTNLIRQFGATLHRPVTVGRVRVNPFALSVTVDSLSVADRDGGELMGWDRFYINFELISIVRRELNFAEIRLVHPHGRFVIRPDGTMNVSDIADSLSAAPSSGPLPVIAIDALHIETAQLVFTDSSTARPFITTVGPWRIDLAQFATRRDHNNGYSFSGRTESGESFAWAGTFAIDPIRSSGALSLDSLKLQKYGPFYERNVGFDVVSGIASLKASYELDLTPGGRVIRVSGGALKMSGLDLVERGRTDTAISIPAAEVTGVAADLLTRRADVAAITADGATVHVLRSPDSSINVLRMLATPSDAGALRARMRAKLVTSTPAAGAAAAAPPAPWRWRIARVASERSSLDILDSAAGRPAHLTLANLSLALDTIASDSGTRTHVRASVTWAPRGTAAAEGAVAIWRRAGELAVTARDLSLRPFDAYLAPRANLLISEGRLTSDARVRFDLADSLRPDYGFKGDVRVDRFATVDGFQKGPFLGFRTLRFSGIDYASRAQRVSVREIALDAPSLDLGVAPDGTPVIRTIFPRAGTDSVPGDSATPAPAKPAAPSKNAAPSMRANIGRIRITNGALRVNDRSLEPAVAFAISKIEATTGRLSSDSLGVGVLDLTASIDDVAPVSVHGRFNPLSAKEGSDLTVSVSGMELIPVGPYAGKYLGYQIAKGKLKVEMQYRVVGRQLNAENKLTLDEFTFGEKTSSPDATSMPVKLGFAIMRDRNGQIVFDVPVEGNLDDPSFRLGRVIGRAIMNVLTKLVTSPFKLLGGMFGGGSTADLSYVEFGAGSAALGAEGSKKLDVLAKSLHERPDLKLEIAGAVDTIADAAALRGAKLDAQLRVRKWTALKAKDADVAPPDSLALTPAERPLWLAAAFAAAFPTDSAVVAAKRSKSKLPPRPLAEMEQRLTATMDVSTADLRLLADARGKTCLEYLLAHPTLPVNADRAFLTSGGEKRDGAKALFTLQQ